eukprot:Gb_12872 [translate_table: standard]
MDGRLCDVIKSYSMDAYPGGILNLIARVVGEWKRYTLRGVCADETFAWISSEHRTHLSMVDPSKYVKQWPKNALSYRRCVGTMVLRPYDRPVDGIHTIGMLLTSTKANTVAGYPSVSTEDEGRDPDYISLACLGTRQRFRCGGVLDDIF